MDRKLLSLEFWCWDRWCCRVGWNEEDVFEGEVQTGISMLFDILLNCAIFLLSVVPDCIRHATSISPDLPKYELKPEKPKSYGFGLDRKSVV